MLRRMKFVEVVVVIAQGPGELLHGPDLRGVFQAAVAVYGVLPLDDLGLGDLEVVGQPILALELLQFSKSGIMCF